MPLLDGIGATQAIRALPDGASSTVPIIALTADAFAQTRERCLMAGMNDFLTKPVSPDKLGATLQRLFGTPVPAAERGGADGHRVVARKRRLRCSITQALDDDAARVAARAPDGVAGKLLRTSCRRWSQRLRVALRDGQALELRVHAHAARGAALNLGLAALAKTALALQEGAPHVPAHEIARLVQRFETSSHAAATPAVPAGLLEAVTE